MMYSYLILPRKFSSLVGATLAYKKEQKLWRLSSTLKRTNTVEIVKWQLDAEDGKLVGDPDVGEFWSLFGGYAPIPQDSPSPVQKQSEAPLVKLSWITTRGKLSPCQTDSLIKEMLETDKCYMLDCDSEIFVWMGRHTSVTERKTSITATEDFLRNQGRSAGTHVTNITEGLETAKFRSFFYNWPQTVELKLYEEGRDKVAAMFKQQGYEVKELPDEEDIQPFIDCRGTLKVWWVDGDKLSLVPASEQKKLFSGDCYILQYTYLGNGRDENLFYAWLGGGSVMEDRTDVISHMNVMVESSRGNPVVAKIMENKEPSQFFSILQTLIVFKGGRSQRYKKFVAEKGIADETYDESKTALFRVQGTSPNNMQAIQVDTVSSSLNSSYCYILQTGTSVITWIGNLSSTRDHDLLDRMLEIINPTWQAISVREGSESDVFWSALGTKADYARGKEIKGYLEDPHLFMLGGTEGVFKAQEIYNFTQDDLNTEDVLVLDCHIEIYVWIGSHSNIKSKQQALALGLKFLETDVLVEGLSLEAPIYVVSEGHEPPFFTRFFEWDFSRSNMHGNSFERKLAILKGKSQRLEAPTRNSWKAQATPNSVRSKSMSSNGRRRSFSSAPGVSFPIVKSSSTPIVGKLFRGSSLNGSPDGSFLSASLPESDEKVYSNGGNNQADGNEDDKIMLVYPYERLTVNSKDPETSIDVTKREAYLSEEEFRVKFGMTKQDFYKLPKWKQNKQKMALHLF
ncbi:villin-1 isoform X2 [Argentina anserina]|uniref:villin-1 isoform X2 n=1 Tax=Argentina anserina TaxID=57926 RepID=UPI00217625DC|nr:villin-1 isoform X2 [Potentilla anserina]